MSSISSLPNELCQYIFSLCPQSHTSLLETSKSIASNTQQAICRSWKHMQESCCMSYSTHGELWWNRTIRKLDELDNDCLTKFKLFNDIFKKNFEDLGKAAAYTKISVAYRKYPFHELRYHALLNEMENQSLIQLWHGLTREKTTSRRSLLYVFNPLQAQDVKGWIDNPTHNALLPKIANLSNLKLAVLPDEMTVLTIHELNLAFNKLAEIPKEFFLGMTGLNILMLSHNFIEEIPQEIQLLKGLQELHLENNKLTALPDSICSLKQLKVLNIKANKITKLPAMIGKLLDLVFLIVSYNSIEALPQSLENLSKLQRFYMDSNELEEFPLSILQMKELKILNLAYNKIDPCSYPQLNMTEILIIGKEQQRTTQAAFSSFDNETKSS